MEATKKIIDKNQTNESKDRAITKAKEIVNAMLDPAYQVAKVLEFLGTIGGPLSPCTTVGSALAVRLSTNANDTRVGADFSRRHSSPLRRREKTMTYAYWHYIWNW